MTKAARLGPEIMAMVARKQAKTGDGSKQESDDSDSDSDDEHDEHQDPRPKSRHSFETQAGRDRPQAGRDGPTPPSCPPTGRIAGAQTSGSVGKDSTGNEADDEGDSGDSDDETQAGRDGPTPPSCPPTGRLAGAQKSPRSHGPRRAGEKRALEEEDGYVDESKKAARKRDGGRSFPVGNQRSCAQDGLINGAKQLGLKIVKKEVYDATLPAKGDTKVEAIVNHGSSVGIQMFDFKAPGTLDVLMFQRKGGPEFALLNQEGVFFVELLVALEGNPNDKHFVVFNSTYTCEDFPHCRGVIIDNDATTPLKHIEPKERENATDARKMFKSLFPGADRVSVVGARLMCPVQPPRREWSWVELPLGSPSTPSEAHRKTLMAPVGGLVHWCRGRAKTLPRRSKRPLRLVGCLFFQ